MIVSFEVAKLLKEKGFDEPCNHVHYEYKVYHYTKSGGVRNSHKKEQQWICTAPDVMQVILWIFKKYGIWIEVHYDAWNTKKFRREAVGGKDVYEQPYHAESEVEFTSPEEAYHEAIKHTLNFLI